MLWKMTNSLPSRADYVGMLGRTRPTTAKGLEETRRSGNVAALLLYQVQLTDWDRLIERLRDNVP
jgi:hypothetical protein